MTHTGSSNTKTVLVVEDDTGLNRLICKKLAQAGYMTASAYTGSDAITVLRERTAGVMVLDYKLPDMSGDAVVAVMKEADISTAFIIMTGYGDERLAVAMMKLGASDYFVKETQSIETLPLIVERIFAVTARDEQQRQTVRFQALTSDILLILNRHDSNTIIGDILGTIKNALGVDAVGIRLRDGDDYPYCEANGFSSDFIGPESRLCTLDEHGIPIRDSSGAPILECICGIVLNGRTDASEPYFTSGGSFWANSITALLPCLTDERMNTRVRNRCHAAGYESVALIPLKHGTKIVGLLQLNDTHADMFNADMLRHLEETAKIIGIAISRRRTENALKESQLIFDRFMEFSPIYVFFKDEHLRTLRLSRNYEGMFGKPLNELIGKSMDDLFPSELSENMMSDDRLVLKNGVPVLSVEVFAERTYRTIKFPIIIEGKPSLLAGFTIDITEQLQSEHALIQLDKMRSMGILSSGIAHELNQPLGAIALSVDMLLMKITRSGLNPAFAQEKLKDMSGYIERLRAIIDELRMFSHDNSGKAAQENFSVNDAVNGVLSFVSAQFRVHGIRLTLSLGKDIPPVAGSRYKLEQAILNLLTNARDAVEEKANVSEASYRKNITVVTKVRDGNVMVKIADNGIGLSEDVQKNIFTPFYTTKPIGVGTGLGMWIAYGIVKAMNGEIKYASRPGIYSAFRIVLPIPAHDPDTHDLAAHDGGAAGGI